LAVEDVTASRIVLEPGNYAFDTSADCTSSFNGKATLTEEGQNSALCIFRGLVLEAQVPGTAVIDARGASAGPRGRRAIFIDFGRTNTLGHSPYTSSTHDTVELIGLKITGGYLPQSNATEVDLGLANGAGIKIHHIQGDVILRRCEIYGNVANDTDSMGGGIMIAPSWNVHSNAFCNRPGSLTRCVPSTVALVDCTARDNIAALGGGVYTMADGLSLSRSSISNCVATSSGGGLYSASGRTTLSNGTLVHGCAAPEGRALNLKGEVSYALPAPTGRWLPNGRCEIFRAACAYHPKYQAAQQSACLAHRDDCSLTYEPPESWYCQEPTFVQPCNWEDARGGDSSLLGQRLYELPASPVEQDFPFACDAGLLGSDDPDEQSSSACAGPCPAGTYCPHEATFEPLLCKGGHFCPAGTSIPFPCEAGTFSKATSLTSAGDCADCPPGHVCAIGSLEPTPCRSGTVAAGWRNDVCTLCPAGYYQDQPANETCIRCRAGSFCPQGASNELAATCKPGQYANLTDDDGIPECFVCPAGQSCGGGGAPPTECSPGTYATGGAAVCSPCDDGTYQPSPGAAGCLECNRGTFCPAGSSLELPANCPSGTFNSNTSKPVLSLDDCEPCAPGFFCAGGVAVPTKCPAGTIAPFERTKACDKCPSGTYQNDTGALSCRKCEGGHYCAEGASAPLPCPVGSFSNATDLGAPDECTACRAGHACSSSSTEPVPCLPGTLAAREGQSICEKCPAGEYQDGSGATSCKACLQGSYCLEGAAAPLPCEAGSYSNRTDLESAGDCEVCPPGYACTTGTVVPRACRAGSFSLGSGNAVCEVCKAGSYQSDTGAVDCVPCGLGSFCPVGASLELPATCDPGTYANMTDGDGLPDCFDCPAGSSCPGGAAPPRQCAAGSYAATERLSECASCSGGTYQDDAGGTGCRACVPGSYCKPGAASPIPCEAGSYSSRTDLEDASQCTLAEKGYFATTGSTKPTPCSPGTFAATEGLFECDSCEPGSSGAGGAFCSKCAAGTYAANPGQGECIPCPHPLSSRGGGVTCSICKTGYYLQDASALPAVIFESPTEHCKPCPPNADCSSPNTTLEALGVPRGFWRASNQTTELHKCVASEHCSGSGTAANVERSRRRLEYGDVGSDALIGAGCDAGHTGPLCEWCVSDEQYFSRKERGCADCPTAARFGILAAALFALAGTIFLSYRALSRIAIKAFRRIFGPEVATRLSQLEARVGFQPKLKIVVSFYQVATTLGPVYGARLHEDFTSWLRLLEFFSFDLLGLTYPDACIGSMSHRLLLAALWPFALILLGSAAFAAHALTVWLLLWKFTSGRVGGAGGRVSDEGDREGDGGQDGGGMSGTRGVIAVDADGDGIPDRGVVAVDTDGDGIPDHIEDVDVIDTDGDGEVTVSELNKHRWRELVRGTQSRILYLAILVAYFVLPSVSRSIFKARMCESFGISVFDPTARRSYLVADLEVLCRSDDEMYRGLDAYFWAFFVLWPVLVPLALLGLLLWIRHDVRALRVTRLSRACRLLWRDYNASFHFWELADMYRKLFLASLVLFIQTDDGSSKLLRLVVASVTSALFLTALALVKPFKRFDDFYLACTANLLLTCCFVLGTVVQICESAAYEDMCDTLVGFESAFGASEFVIVLTVTMIAVSLVLVVFKTISALRAPTIRLRSNRRAPVMDLSKKCHFHGFISHIWSTGQDQTHTIVRQIKLVMPDARIWLDVDCLENLGALEESVGDATTFLVFLSVGYFKSRNCRRELYAGLALDRPFIPIHEADVEKGGAALEVLEAECRTNCVDDAGLGTYPSYSGPAEMVARIFEKEDPILWVRVNAFQLESLKSIALRMLRHSPYYMRHPETLTAGVMVAGEVPPYAFVGPVTILVCRDNDGAWSVAEEVQEAAKKGRALVPKAAKDGVVAIREADDALENLVDDSRHVLLLYMTNRLWYDPDGTVARLVQAAMDRNITIAMVHEQTPNLGGCPFSTFFQGQTPQVLLQPPYSLYNALAIPLYGSPEHRKVSLRHVLRHMGAASCDAGLLRRKLQRLRHFMSVARLVRTRARVESQEDSQQRRSWSKWSRSAAYIRTSKIFRASNRRQSEGSDLEQSRRQSEGSGPEQSTFSPLKVFGRGPRRRGPRRE